jgi:hypothetical protein
VVLTAGSSSASLLGAVSLREKGSLGAWAWSGVGAFAVLGLLAAWLVAPSTDWTFSLEPKWMLRRYVDGDVVEAHSLSSLYRETAEYADEYYVKNEAKLRWRTRGLSLGCVLLVVELVTLLMDLGTRR